MDAQSQLKTRALEISQDDKTAILFGASGLVGGHCLRALLTHPTYKKVIAFGRSELKATHPKLQKVVVDFSDLEQYKELIQGEDIFICLGTTRAKAGSKAAFRQVDYKYVFHAAKIAALNGVNQLFLVSSVGANPKSRIHYLQVKGEAEEAIKRLPFWSVHIFQPSLLLGKRSENRFGESIAQKLGKGLDFIFRGAISRYKPVEAEVVAKAMVSAAQQLKSGVHVYSSQYLQALSEDYYRNK